VSPSDPTASVHTVVVPIQGEATTADRTVQRRTIGTLVGSQVLGGVGMASGIAVGSLLAEDVSGSAEVVQLLTQGEYATGGGLALAHLAGSLLLTIAGIATFRALAA